MSKEKELVNLYCTLIEFLPEQADLFLKNLKIETTDSDTIVHILNALSPKSNKIKDWDRFVVKAKSRLIELEGFRVTNDLMKVIMTPKS